MSISPPAHVLEPVPVPEHVRVWLDGLDVAGLAGVQLEAGRLMASMSMIPLADSDVEAVVAATEQVSRYGDGIQLRAVTEGLIRGLPGVRGAKPGAWVRGLAWIAGYEANQRVRDAAVLGPRTGLDGRSQDPVHPVTAQAVFDGRCSRTAARTIVKAIDTVGSAEQREDADVILGTAARDMTPEDIAKLSAKILDLVDPDRGQADEVCRRKRGLVLGKQDAYGMSKLSGHLTPEGRAVLEPILEKLARPGVNNPDDGEPLGADASSEDVLDAARRDRRNNAQRQHDAFVTALRNTLVSGLWGVHRGLPVTVIATMDIHDLERETGLASTASGGTLPVKDLVRMAQPMHPYLVICDQRRPLDLYRGSRLASIDQRIALYGAERGCSRPGCDAPATRTQVNHVKEWRDGGFTNIEYLTLVCDGCHPMLNPDGTWQTDLVGPDGQPVSDNTTETASRGDPPDHGPTDTDAVTGRGDTPRPNTDAETGQSDAFGHDDSFGVAADPDRPETGRCTTPRVLWKRTGAASYEPLNTRHHPEEELAKYTAIAERERRR